MAGVTGVMAYLEGVELIYLLPMSLGPSGPFLKPLLKILM